MRCLSFIWMISTKYGLNNPLHILQKVRYITMTLSEWIYWVDANVIIKKGGNLPVLSSALDDEIALPTEQILTISKKKKIQQCFRKSLEANWFWLRRQLQRKQMCHAKPFLCALMSTHRCAVTAQKCCALWAALKGSAPSTWNRMWKVNEQGGHASRAVNQKSCQSLLRQTKHSVSRL